MDSVDVRIVPSCTPQFDDDEDTDLVLRRFRNGMPLCRRRRRNTKNRQTKTINVTREPSVPARTRMVTEVEVAGEGVFRMGDVPAVEVVVEVDRGAEYDDEDVSLSTTCWVRLNFGKTKKCCKI